MKKPFTAILILLSFLAASCSGQKLEVASYDPMMVARHEFQSRVDPFILDQARQKATQNGLSDMPKTLIHIGQSKPVWVEKKLQCQLTSQLTAICYELTTIHFDQTYMMLQPGWSAEKVDESFSNVHFPEVSEKTALSIFLKSMLPVPNITYP